jgi:hypothetical protein
MQDSRNPFQEVEVKRAEVKLPPFFFNKAWDLGQPVESHSASDDMPKEDGERRCYFSVNPEDRFGMVLEETLEPLPQGLLIVSGMDAGSAFMRTSSGAPGIRAGDVIVEVDGQRGRASELREALVNQFSINGQRMISLVVRSRPSAFNIELWRRGGKKTGLTVGVDKTNAECLLVQNVHAKGLAPAWNAAHGSLRICKGDLITHVNGIAQDVEAMKREIENCTAGSAALRLRIVGPGGQIGLHEEANEEESQWPLTTVPWDMQVRWLDDISESSTTASGLVTPVESVTSGTSTPVER